MLTAIDASSASRLRATGVRGQRGRPESPDLEPEQAAMIGNRDLSCLAPDQCVRETQRDEASEGRDDELRVQEPGEVVSSEELLCRAIEFG